MDNIIFPIIDKNQIESFIKLETPGVYGFLNPYSSLYAPDQGILYAIDSYYLSKFIGVERASFDNSSIAPILFNHLKKHPRKCLFIGGSEEESEDFKKKVFNQYKIEILTINGYETTEHYKSIIDLIKPDFTVIGIGTPKQESLAIQLSKINNKSIYVTCGGYITQGSRNLNYFPKIFTILHLHFLYRLLKEPHVLKRILIYYPKFIIKYIYGKIQFKKR